MKWITREKVKVDRVACPWLIRKFVDKALANGRFEVAVGTGARSQFAKLTTFERFNFYNQFVAFCDQGVYQIDEDLVDYLEAQTKIRMI